MKTHRVGEGERSLAVFIDFENMGLGFGNRRDRFEIGKVLERLVEKGKIVAKKAYADWSRFGMYTGGLHEAAIELVEIPRRGMSGKNSADIRLVVDAIDLAYSKDHIDTFVIVSGDSDFSPLVSKLKELGKHVIGLGLVDATSDLLRDNCDEFIYYEDLDRAPIIPVGVNEQIPEKKRKGLALLLDSLLALRRENKEVIYSSMVKETMKRKKPSFNEEYYGYRTFSELLEDAAKEGLLELDKHKASGMYIVTRFGLEMKGGTPAPIPVVANGGPPKVVNGGPPKIVKPTVLPAPEERKEPREAGGRPPAREPAAGGRGRGTGGGRGGRAATPLPATPLPAPTRPPAAARVEVPSAAPRDDRPLGRALVDEIDMLDDLDEIPSYAPRKAVPAAAKPATAPARPAPAKPAAPARVAAPKPAADTPVEPEPKRGRAAPRRKPAEPTAETPTAPLPKPAIATARPAPAVPKPAPKPLGDDDDFGAGLD